MAEVSFHHFLDEDISSEDIVALDSFPYWSYISGSDSLSHRHIHDQFSDDFSGDRKNQVNFVVDLFHERVEQSHVIDQFITQPVNESSFGLIGEENDLDLSLGLGLGLGLENEMDEISDCGGDEFFISRRDGANIESDSDEEEGDDLLGIDVHSEEEDYGVDNVNDSDIGIPLCWDSLQLDDHVKESNEFEWEEVDGRVDESEVLSNVPDRAISGREEEGDRDRGRARVNSGWEVLLNLDGINEMEDGREVLSIEADPDEEGTISVDTERGGAMRNSGWEVLLNENNLGDTPDFGEPEVDPDEYEMMLGQLPDVEDAYLGRPPASRAVVERLPLVVITNEDVVNEKALCAVCKDQIGVGEEGKQLPCSHLYHGDCILPWLGIRNTCPVCRFELPTDDFYYEQRRIQRASRVM